MMRFFGKKIINLDILFIKLYDKSKKNRIIEILTNFYKNYESFS